MRVPVQVAVFQCCRYPSSVVTGALVPTPDCSLFGLCGLPHVPRPQSHFSVALCPPWTTQTSVYTHPQLSSMFPTGNFGITFLPCLGPGGDLGMALRQAQPLGHSSQLWVSLRGAHLFLGFPGRWLPQNRVPTSQSPNPKSQDGVKMEMRCLQCSQELS